jgi:diguanylate cyclase (GGDEF)-like protein
MREAAQAHVAQLSHQAFHDSLTGLPNRSHLLERAEDAVARASAAGARTALLLLDLNGFKQVNDTAGHQAGDILLQRVAQRLLASVRDDDVVARLGGDEFAILASVSATFSAGMLAERLRRAIHGVGAASGVTASVGVAEVRVGDDLEDLLFRADSAMYAAKTAGGDRVTVQAR